MRRRITYLLIAFTGLAPAGCAGMAKPTTKPSSWDSASSSKTTNTEALRRDLMNFADRFASSTVAAYDELASKAPDADAKTFAVERKHNGVASAYVNASEPNPIVGLLDMLVMVRLLRQGSEDAWFTERFGAANASELANKLKVQEEDLWKLAPRYVSDEQLGELRDVIDDWRQAHPTERYVSMVRVSDFPQAQSASASKGLKSVFGLLFLDPFSGLDPTMREVQRSRELVERVFFYVQRMPTLLSWRVEALSQQALRGPEIQKLTNNVSEFAAVATRFNQNAEAITKLVGRFPQQLSEERQRAVEHVAKKATEERSATVRQVSQAVSVERDAVIRQSEAAVASQRDAAVKQVAQAVAAEREVVVAELNASLTAQREAIVRDMEAATGRVITRVFILACVAVSLGVLLATLAVLTLRHYAKGGTPPPRRQGHGKVSFG